MTPKKSKADAILGIYLKQKQYVPILLLFNVLSVYETMGRLEAHWLQLGVCRREACCKSEISTSNLGEG